MRRRRRRRRRRAGWRRSRARRPTASVGDQIQRARRGGAGGTVRASVNDHGCAIAARCARDREIEMPLRSRGACHRRGAAGAAPRHLAHRHIVIITHDYSMNQMTISIAPRVTMSGISAEQSGAGAAWRSLDARRAIRRSLSAQGATDDRVHLSSLWTWRSSLRGRCSSRCSWSCSRHVGDRREPVRARDQALRSAAGVGPDHRAQR